ncbi:acyltransferase [Ancylomarina euxinus]|uniref:Acyltransferase n=1 Tax=Ancylomarina euxinus TaxID=2283627 RepID=A0A425XWQ9_9BACT|nr:acyltransferase [Ancylomarina euxinus]MCZ4696340.1 acyltransferase [Ancylomarina euxinus]MUP16759.1 acyltransferase [Ancylomarina euxinus]RRG19079.1 acyltransferase [Ancylomarina euxinus]
MDFKKQLYLSPFGRIISLIQNVFSFISRPYMVYGYYSKFDKKFKKHTRISSSSIILNKENLNIGDNVWIWHYSIIDASNKVTIGDGCQIGAWVGIFTHSSHVSIRLYGGNSYIETEQSDRLGYLKGAVNIGDYTFVGAKASIMPNVTIGKGCLIAAGALVNKSVPDFSIIVGNPGVIKGSTLDLDERYFSDELIQKNYFDKKTIDEFLKLKQTEIV